VSAITIDVQGYSAALSSFNRGVFPPPELLFPILAQAVRRSIGLGMFCGIFYGSDCQFTSIGAAYNLSQPMCGAISASLAASVAGVLQQRYTPPAISACSLACGATVYAYRHVKHNMDIEVHFGYREGE
jgi:hypothetical protein